jgi:hypothetical protein
MKSPEKRRSIICMIATLTAVGLINCGDKPGQGPGGRPIGKVETAFIAASQATGVPVRFLIAAGYLESRLVPTIATSNYVSEDDSEVARGTVMTQSAFALSQETLGLDPTKPASATLVVQIEAYARWLAAKFKESGLALTASPRTQEDKFYWIENLALLHRKGADQRRVVQVMFARELIAILNEGFVWQDPASGETLTLDKETPPIDVEALDFPQSGKNWFKLTPGPGEIEDTPYFKLASSSNTEVINEARRVEVIHCPLTLSACLELQTRSRDSDAQVGSYVYLSAHYAIPSDFEIYKPARMQALQVAPLTAAITITDSAGESVAIQDAIVIMLTGNSGRTVGGTRQPAVPTWFRNNQLMAMSSLINDICTRLSERETNPVNREECMKPEGERGVRFRNQGTSEDYRWGDIADFDDTIFNAYVRNPGGLSDEIAFELARGNREFQADADIPLTVLFNSSAREVHIERLSRCQGGKLVWETVANRPVRGTNREVFAEGYFDSGPNGDGEQFFRARVYGKDTKLVGWAIEQVYIKNYEKEPKFASEKSCED